MPSALCSYCSQIDFGPLRLPTAGELTALNEGRPAPDRHPYKEHCSAFKGSRGTPYWNLGLQSRIETGSARQLCAAIRHVLHRAVSRRHLAQGQWARAEGQDLLCIAFIVVAGCIHLPEGIVGSDTLPKITIRHLSLRWLRPWSDVCQSPGRIELPSGPGDDGEVLILSSCLHVTSRELSMYDVVEARGLRPNFELFGGRLISEFIDPRLPRLWVEDCFSNHRDICGRSLSGVPRYVRLLAIFIAIWTCLVVH